MPTKDEISVSRVGVTVAASDDTMTRLHAFDDEPTARRLEIRLKNDKRFARHWLRLGDIGDPA